ncbi:MAG TPA: metallopeptidase TldD-related protein, partial [Pyrinomonadaceae bacterium]|nr:metallopeptidase TldD-related protein [Pyrinomonadaceae bacterium]
MKINFPSFLMRGFSLIIIFSTLFSITFAQSNFFIPVLEEEQQRAMRIFKDKTDLPPYFLSYLVTDIQSWGVSASQGFLINSGGGKSRILDTVLRVGDFKLDNTHNRGAFRNSRALPLEDDKDAIKSVLWTTTDRIYKDAVESYTQIQTRKDTRAVEENLSDDFSPSIVKKEVAPTVSQKVDLKILEARAKKISAVFKKYPQIFNSGVSFSISATNRYFVSSEGTSLQHGKNLVSLSIQASTRAEDGMDLARYEIFNATTISGLPNDEELLKAAEIVAKDVIDLKNAPLAEPYDGPAILSGRASGVFFHEIFGHRIEGHRQKGGTEGNTFTKRVNQEVLPPFISVVDDPTIPKLGTTDLNGFYQFDEEGVPAQKVPLVENGVLKNFLMSRSPIQDFATSNGHGRAAAGLSPVSRQGNLFVQAKQTVSNK